MNVIRACIALRRCKVIHSDRARYPGRTWHAVYSTVRLFQLVKFCLPREMHWASVGLRVLATILPAIFRSPVSSRGLQIRRTCLGVRTPWSLQRGPQSYQIRGTRHAVTNFRICLFPFGCEGCPMWLEPWAALPTSSLAGAQTRPPRLNERDWSIRVCIHLFSDFGHERHPLSCDDVGDR